MRHSKREILGSMVSLEAGDRVRVVNAFWMHSDKEYIGVVLGRLENHPTALQVRLDFGFELPVEERNLERI